MKQPEKWQKRVEQKVNTLFNKVLGENEKYVFYFYLNIKGTFGTFLTGLWVRSGNRALAEVFCSREAWTGVTHSAAFCR